MSTQPPAITSYLNALGLSEGYYSQALHWLHSSAFSIDTFAISSCLKQEVKNKTNL
ncbi:MAG: hypothetical protein MJA27_24940 [Pseudanabaenales cyanobacterium]|nr:hypothetical protein [Pseudanabaenales cyanobacterium]